MPDQENVEEGVNKTSETEGGTQTFLEWQKDRYIYLETDKEGNKWFECLNIVNGKYNVLVRIRICKRSKDGKWETVLTTYKDFWEFGKLADIFKAVARRALQKQLNL